ncbi:MAG TPA: efflux RND transporter permease subunit [Xanthobacteraceae bacterium]|jgi:hydrophobe/amphiphile efflux-1 (HAE1) family protein|nr:efflux RND transporter permease subunit [Xanthobacteraceae bacterium]
MNFSYPFIRRPIGTTLLAIGLFLLGIVAYTSLPVASLPSVDFPTVRVSATRPGADPETMAATVAAPLERRLGEISGVTEMTSSSSFGSTRIVIQFDLTRDIEGAARDVQAAINAALSDLPLDLQSVPTVRKANPAAAPIMILALTSKTLTASDIYDAADTVIAQRIAQVEGIGEVSVSGAEQPAVRVSVNPVAIASMGVSLESIRTAIVNANAAGPLGVFDGARRTEAIATNAQMAEPSDYNNIVVRASNGNVVRLSDIATIDEGTRNRRSAAWFNSQPAVLLVMTKEPNANVIDTVSRIYDIIPEIKKRIPEGIDISVLSDRTQTISASVRDMQYTLLATIILVMFVVFIFLRRAAATIAAGVTVPLSLAGTCAAMWAVGFSIDNISLMALAVSVGFVVDDAIVMIENAFRNLDRGMSPLRATLAGARQIGFTVVSISVSLIAAFIPLLFMGDVIGRLFREFSVTLAFSIAISTVISLSVTPMICAHFVHKPPSPDATWLDRTMEAVVTRLQRGYRKSLKIVMGQKLIVMVVFIITIALTVALFIKTPKGYFPQDDTGLIVGGTSASPDISFTAMAVLQQRVMKVVLSDPAVQGLGSSIGSSGFNASVNRGSLFIGLKPPDERDVSSLDVVNRLRSKLSAIPGVSVFLFPAQDVRAGGRGGNSAFQYALWGPSSDEIQQWVPKVVERLKRLPELVDVDTDRNPGGLQATVKINRAEAARLGIAISDIDNALNNAFSQRQISTIYTQRNQYKVVLEIDPRFQRDPNDVKSVYVTAKDGSSISLANLVTITRGIAPLVVNHQGQYPSVTISFSPAPNVTIGDITEAVTQAVAEMHLPDSVHAEFAGDAKSFRASANTQPLLILAAIIAVYIVLGVLYESLIHPLTIISTLPSAGLGALLALQLFGAQLTIIALIGIILLVGIVKKNGIMLVDFALEAERKRGLTAEQAIMEACSARFRPILMTTLASLLGALPFIIAAGPGSELRRPLGMTIVGGLFVSQLLTLYTTPVIYLLLNRVHQRVSGATKRKSREEDPTASSDPATRPV